jgi:hypothetical protein
MVHTLRALKHMEQIATAEESAEARWRAETERQWKVKQEGERQRRLALDHLSRLEQKIGLRESQVSRQSEMQLAACPAKERTSSRWQPTRPCNASITVCRRIVVCVRAPHARIHMCPSDAECARAAPV